MRSTPVPGASGVPSKSAFNPIDPFGVRRALNEFERDWDPVSTGQCDGADDPKECAFFEGTLNCHPCNEYHNFDSAIRRALDNSVDPARILDWIDEAASKAALAEESAEWVDWHPDGGLWPTGLLVSARRALYV